MTCSPAPAQPDRPGDSPHVVSAALARLRSDLYGGRGPGISEADRLANTSLRPTIAGVPTAASREQLHLRTLRARGEFDTATSEARWAAAQFSAPNDTIPAGATGVTHQLAGPAAWLAAAALWLHGRRRRRQRDNGA